VLLPCFPYIVTLLNNKRSGDSMGIRCGSGLRAAVLLSLLSVPFAAQAQVDLTALDRDMAGPRARVLVLGTVHLREMPASFNPAALNGVLDRLAAFKPEIVTIETESGEECDMAARHPAKYGADYCPSTAAAMAATGLDVPAAMAEVDKTLKTWPAQAAPAQRRRLAALFLAANDRASAYVQWLQLPASERRAGDSLNGALVDQLGKLASRKDESYQIAATLAARLGLQRVHAVDNHTGDRIDVPDIKAFLQPLEAAWAAGGAELGERDKRQKPLLQAADLLPFYRVLNSPESMRVHAEANVVEPMRAKSPERYPQMWVAGWEIRNLRMVANIRETFRERPGARVVAIVGASHKPWFDAWLGQLQGVDIVDVAAVLK
jgi:pheromone shutdown protein TraB